MNSTATLGPRLHVLRSRRSLSQAKLAERSNLSRATVAAIEGQRYARVSLQTLLALSRGLGIPLESLIGADEKVPQVQAFLDSPWFAATKATLAELDWLESLPAVIWADIPNTAQSVAELLAWRRRHRKQ